MPQMLPPSFIICSRSYPNEHVDAQHRCCRTSMGTNTEAQLAQTLPAPSAIVAPSCHLGAQHHGLNHGTAQPVGASLPFTLAAQSCPNEHGAVQHTWRLTFIAQNATTHEARCGTRIA